MQQRFNTRNYSVRDFEEWQERGELVLAPKFQRRDVWSDKARSYLIDTILNGKPIPKIYMRQDTNLGSRRTLREIVDGQQRLRTVLNFVKDGFKISRAHGNNGFGGKYFSGLKPTTQKEILKYEFVVDLLQDMPDNEVYDVFARINTYAEKLKPQELRNARWFGDFKSSVYSLSKEFLMFFETNKVFSSKLILRMAEAEFISELLLAMHEGIREGKKDIIDTCYRKYDDDFPGRKTYEKRFRETIDIVSGISGTDLPQLKFRAARLLYPFFCAIYHMRFKLPRLRTATVPFKTSDYPKMKAVLESIDDFLEKADASATSKKPLQLAADERKFYDAYSEHWVHAEERTILTEYLCRRFASVLKS